MSSTLGLVIIVSFQHLGELKHEQSIDVVLLRVRLSSQLANVWRIMGLDYGRPTSHPSIVVFIRVFRVRIAPSSPRSPCTVQDCVVLALDLLLHAIDLKSLE